MNDERDTIDAWWHALETDQRWRRHMEYQAELRNLQHELESKNGISQRHDPIEIPGKS
jgi:hypothetical protein